MRHFERCENRYMATLNHPEKEKPRKPYEKPVARKIMPEEAKRKLIEHVSQGSQDAKEFLEMILADEAKKLSTGTKKWVTASE
jgi:hypothetical protein